MFSQYPDKKITIIGGGIIGAMEAYYAYLEEKKQGRQIRITIYDKNEDITQTTVSNIAPSLTPDEILSVVPRGHALVEKLGILFNQPGGIRVEDVKGVNGSEVARAFIGEVQQYSKDEKGHEKRTEALLKLGKKSMELWQNMYDEADSELKKILEDSNFNPCREPRKPTSVLHDGYRIDLISNIPNAKTKAEAMKKDYEGLGYVQCKILSPAEVKVLDPFLSDFCDTHSEAGAWKNDTVALYRPGGCLDAEIFLPKFYAYLNKVMGTYTNEAGHIKNCFQLKFGRHINAVVYVEDSHDSVVKGLKYGEVLKTNKHTYKSAEYIFCPGEAVGTLKKLGFEEPTYAGFAGASLKLNIPVPPEKREEYSSFNHCMEVHREGVVLAWQARFRHNQIFIGVAGTKAFYADKSPDKHEDFAKDRNLLQLNMINDVLPGFVSLALGKNSKEQQLTANDLKYLEERGIATRWVGTRSVTYDGFPTLGNVHNAQGEVKNARCTTHLGSGGVSFAPAAVIFSRGPFDKEKRSDMFEQEVLNYSNSRRATKGEKQ